MVRKGIFHMKKCRLSQLPIGTIFYYSFDYYRIESKSAQHALCYCVIDGSRNNLPSSFYVEPLTKKEGEAVLEMAERGSGARR